ncbi:MAG: hypothetical protein R3B60_01765 [Candidatus Paceibacterota bacterium]
MNQAEAFRNLYYKTLEGNIILNCIALSIANKVHSSKILRDIKGLSNLITYIKQLLENRKRAKTKLEHVSNNDYLKSIFDNAVINNLCSGFYITKLQNLMKNNNLTDLLDDLIEKCESLEIDISIIKDRLKENNYTHNVGLEFEENWLEFCAYIKIIHVITDLIHKENAVTKPKAKPSLLTLKKPGGQTT